MPIAVQKSQRSEVSDPYQGADHIVFWASKIYVVGPRQFAIDIMVHDPLGVPDGDFVSVASSIESGPDMYFDLIMPNGEQAEFQNSTRFGKPGILERLGLVTDRRRWNCYYPAPCTAERLGGTSGSVVVFRLFYFKDILLNEGEYRIQWTNIHVFDSTLHRTMPNLQGDQRRVEWVDGVMELSLGY